MCSLTSARNPFAISYVRQLSFGPGTSGRRKQSRGILASVAVDSWASWDTMDFECPRMAFTASSACLRMVSVLALKKDLRQADIVQAYTWMKTV